MNYRYRPSIRPLGVTWHEIKQGTLCRPVEGKIVDDGAVYLKAGVGGELPKAYKLGSREHHGDELNARWESVHPSQIEIVD